MSRVIKVAAIQMDATPAPLEARLERAEALIAEAAASGAQLVILPELFNSGYIYDEENYARAEVASGRTVSWMKALAAAHNIHLMGTLMLLDVNEVYNSALLVAPDERLWRYDKNYPFIWERAYFREGKGTTVAETDLGKLGIMICFDSAHPHLWANYAGKVDAMLIASCPPKMSSVDLVFPGKERVNLRELGGHIGSIYTDKEYAFDRDMDDYAAWLGVPVVHTVGAGRFRSRLPLPIISLIGFIAERPDLWRWLPQAAQVWIEAGYDRQTKIVGANGQVLSRVSIDGDGFTVNEIALAETLPVPFTPQPRMQTPAIVYFLADLLGAVFMPAVYRNGLRKQYGAHMAPLSPRTMFIFGGLITGLVMGVMLGQRRAEQE